MAIKPDYTIKAAIITGACAIAAACINAWLTYLPAPNRSSAYVPTTTAAIVTVTPPLAPEEQLRDANRVKYASAKMGVAQNELPFSKIPLSSWGYGWPDKDTLIGDIKMYELANDSQFEIHKIQTGEALIVGFVGPDASQKLSLPSPPEGYEFTLYSKRWADAPSITTLPLKTLKVTTFRFIRLKEAQIGALDLKVESNHGK